MEKLRTEITLAFGSAIAITRSDLTNMKYLQNVLKESKTASLPVENNHRSNSLTLMCSPSTVSSGSRKLSDCSENHRPPGGWGTGPHVTRFCTARDPGRVQRLRPAQTT